MRHRAAGFSVAEKAPSTASYRLPAVAGACNVRAWFGAFRAVRERTVSHERDLLAASTSDGRQEKTFLT